jgi:hypothetical protein
VVGWARGEQARGEQARGEQVLRCLTIHGSLDGLAAAQFRLDAGMGLDPLRDAWSGCLAAAEQRHRDLHTWGVVPGQPGRDQIGVVMHTAEVPRSAQIERGRHQRVRGILIHHVKCPRGQVPELGGAVDPAALRLGDLTQHRYHAGDPGPGRGGQLRRLRAPAGLGHKPGADRHPAAPPVLKNLVTAHQRAVICVSRAVQQRPDTGRLDLRDRRGQARQVPVEFGHEVTHVRHQRVFMAQEHFR